MLFNFFISLLIINEFVSVFGRGVAPMGKNNNGLYGGSHSSISEFNSLMGIIFIVLGTFLLIVGFISCISMCYCRYCSKSWNSCEDCGSRRSNNRRNLVQCYLCANYIRKSNWSTHRISCLRKNSRILSKFSICTIQRCPSNHVLRLWPLFIPGTLLNYEFSCGSTTCERVKDNDGNAPKLTGNGNNRYNCFICDYDRCDDCIFNGNPSLNGDNPPPYYEVFI